MCNPTITYLLNKLDSLTKTELAALLTKKMDVAMYDDRNRMILLRLGNMKAEELYEIYTKEELIELILQMDFQQTEEMVRERGFIYHAVEHPCIICHLKQALEEFEWNIEICSECLGTITKPQIINYIHRLLDYIDSNIATLIYQKLQSKSVNEIRQEFTMDELEDMVMELATGLDYYMEEEIETTIDEIEYVEDLEEQRLVFYGIRTSILDQYPITDLTAYVRKFQQGERKKNEAWRKHVPEYLKQEYSGWKTGTVKEVYDKTNQLISTNGKLAREQLMGFSADLSRIIFDNTDETHVADEPIYDLDEAEAHITYIIEMIMLPQLDMLDQIEDNRKNLISTIHLDKVSTTELTDSLINEIKDRDNGKCMMCSSDIDLHVHYRIDESYGAISDENNLVTLCSSCKDAVETANLDTAITKGLSNYNRALGRRLLERERL